MKPSDSASPETAVPGSRERSNHSSPHPGDETRSSLPAVVPKRRWRFPANITEFLLVFRLRARRAMPTTDMLERAVQVVMVTCRQWFGETKRPKREVQHQRQ